MENELKRISQFIDYISRYSSGDNCQPFEFNYIPNERVIEIFYNAERAKHKVNSHNILSLISLGSIFELAKFCAKENYFEIKTTSFIDSDLTNINICSTWGKIEFLKFPKNEISLGLLEKVKTNRSAYKISNSIFQSGSIGKDILFSKDISNESKELIIEIEAELVWKDPTMLKDTFKWIRSSKRSYEKLRDGFFYPELAISQIQAFLLIFISQVLSPKLISGNPIVRIFLKRLTRSNLKHTDSFALITSPLNNANDWMELGASFARLRFFAASKGMESQPLSVATMSYTFAVKNLNNPNLKIKKLGKELQVSLKKEFNIENEDLFAAWLFRIGAPYKVNELSLRKNEFKINGDFHQA